MFLIQTHTPLPVLVAALFGLLVLATLIVEGLRWRQPARDWSELRLRVRTWWMIAGLFAAALLLHRTVTLLFFALVSGLALREFLSIIPTRPVDRRLIGWAYGAVPLQFLWIQQEAHGLFLVFIPIYMFLFLALNLVLGGETRGFLQAASSLFWGLMITVFSLSHVAYLLTAPLPVASPAGGAGLLFYLVFLTQVNDVAQYLFGKALGRRPILPRVSPRKTWEGFVGGLLTTTLLAWLLAPWLTALHPWQALITGLLLASAGFAGDVTISALKRDLALKDSGALLPGHGGLLDRIDSLTYSAPLFLHVLLFFYG